MSDGALLHFFVGKGGAGKTTLSSAYSINLAEKNAKDKVLVLSPETTSSLADIFKKKLTNKPTKLFVGKGEGGLFAAEWEPKEFADAFTKTIKVALRGAAEKGSIMSADDVATWLDASSSNLGELAWLFELKNLVEAKTFDRIVVDGWAATHTIRFVDNIAHVRRMLGLVRGEKMGKGKAAAPKPSTLDPVIVQLEGLATFLKDVSKTAWHLVAVAEPVSDLQTRWLFNSLKERGVTAADITVNQIEDGKASQIASARRGSQAPHVRRFQTLGVKVELMQRRVQGPVGFDELKVFGKEYTSGKETKSLAFSPSDGPPALVRAPSMPAIAAAPLPPTRFIFFVGAGGVGKSSCACAAAVTLTEKEGPVLLVSTDPAHSISEVLQNRLTDTESQVKGTKGLYARELDVEGWFHVFKKHIKEVAEKAFGPELKGQEFSQDREMVRNLLDTIPTGFDELAALSSLTDSLVQERFKRIVIDPAPGGNVVRILELVGPAKAWLTALAAVFGKYRTKGLGAMADELAALCRHVERFEKAIVNPAEARFVVVTRGEDLAIPATERLVEYLLAKKLPVERVIVNRVLPKTICPLTEERRGLELEVAKQLEKRISVPVSLAPALGRYPAGLRELKGFRTAWYALTIPTKVKAA